MNILISAHTLHNIFYYFKISNIFWVDPRLIYKNLFKLNVYKKTRKLASDLLSFCVVLAFDINSNSIVLFAYL